VSLEAMIRRQVPFSALSRWRRVSIVCCIAAFVFAAAMFVNVELNMYPSAPDHAVPETGEVYGVNINHGFIRYVTLRDKTRLEFWESNARNICGLAMLASVFLWMTFKGPVSPKQPGPRVNMGKDSHRT
jgi:hypothetical protein